LRAALCIDLEPDSREGTGGRDGDWAGAAEILGDQGWLRSALDPGDRAPLSWFVRADPYVEAVRGSARWALDHHLPGLEPLLDAGDEVGLHAHNLRWSQAHRRWVNDWSDEWTAVVVDCALAAFHDATGQTSRAYRHGDRFTSPVTTRRLLDSSVLVDLTTEPGAPATATLLPDEVSVGGVIPHVDPAMSRPYQPHPDCVDLPVVPDGRLTVVPITTVAVPNGRHEVLWLTTDPVEFRRRLRIRLLDPGLEHLAFVLRSDVFARRTARDSIEANLAHLRRAVDELEWVAASAFVGTAGRPEDFRADGSGALAAQADAVLDLLGHTGPASELPVSAATRAADELASLREGASGGDRRPRLLGDRRRARRG
jgi:hypothetical protein